MENMAMEDTKQETDFEDLQWLHDGLMAKVNEKLDKYSNLSADMMSKKCHDLMQELEKMHKLHVDSLTRFQNNQPEHKTNNDTMSRLSAMKTSLIKWMDNNQTVLKNFCSGDDQLKLNFNNDVKDNNEMTMFYLEYVEVYQYLQQLKVFKLSNTSKQRLNLGYRHAKQYLQIDSKSSVSSQILCAMVVYLTTLASIKLRSFADLLKKMISLETKYKNINTATLIKDLATIGITFFTTLFDNTYEKEYCSHVFGSLKDDKRMILWLMFGINSVDIIINGKLKSRDFFAYLRTLLKYFEDEVGCHYLIARLSILLTINIVSNFENIDDDIQKLDYVLTKQVSNATTSGTNTTHPVSPVVTLFQNESKQFRIASIKFATKMIHSAILCCYKQSPPKDDEFALEQNIIKTIKFFVPLLSKMTSAYYNCIKYDSVCPSGINTSSNININGTRYQTLMEQVRVPIPHVGSAGWLHYAVQFYLTEVIEYLVKELKFDLDFVTSIEIDGKTISSSPRDKVRNNEKLKQHLRRLSLDIPSPFEKTTINQVYFQVLEHNAIVQTELTQYDTAQVIKTPLGDKQLKNVSIDDEQKNSDSTIASIWKTVVKTVKQNQAVSAVHLSLVTRYYGKFNKPKARAVVDAFVQQIEKFINGEQKNKLLEKERTKRYYFNSLFLHENVEEILDTKEKNLIEGWKKNKMKNNKMGFWEKMKVDFDENDDNTTTNEDENVKAGHKRCNSDALAKMTHITVEDVMLYRNWEQCEQKQKKAMMAIKTQNKNSKEFKKLMSMDLEPLSSEARQDSFPQGVHPIHETAQWEKYLSKSSSYEYKLESGRTYAHDMVARGHLLNDIFQQQMKQIVTKHIPGGNFKPAPVKKVDRVIEKSETKYKKCRFPTAAHVLDIIRCSILFTNIKDLVFGIEKLRELIKLGKCGGVKSIVRDKNDYSKMKKWKKFQDAEVYADWKSNALFIHGDIGMIVEIQFLHHQCETAKKLGHSTYKINRRWPIGVEVSFRLSRNVRPFYSEHYFKQLFHSRNYDTLTNALSSSPFSILSIKNEWKNLFDIKYSSPNRFYGDGFSLFLDCILEVVSKVENGDELLNTFFNSGSPLEIETADTRLVYLV